MKNKKFPINDTYNYRSILDDPAKTSEFITRRINQKIDWYFKNREIYQNEYAHADWKEKVIDFFYGNNLGLKVSDFGHIIAKTENVLIIDWENDCPILKRCLDQKIDLKMVCSTLYSTQYQALLTLIEPGLFFSRNYKMIRPEHQFCREIIYYHNDFKDDLAICHLKNIVNPLAFKKILKYHLTGQRS